MPQTRFRFVPVRRLFLQPAGEELSLQGGTPTLNTTSWTWAFDPATAGLTNVVNRPFDSKASSDADRGVGSFPNKTTGSEGWDGSEWNRANLTIEVESGGLLSSPNVMRFRHPAGLSAGSSPGVAQTQSFTGAVHGSRRDTILYVRNSFKLGPTYLVGSVRNKYYFHRMSQFGGASRVEPYLGFGNAGGGRFRIYVNFQGCADSVLGHIDTTVAPGNALNVDEWYGLEVYLERNSAFGVADGIFRLWVNGVLCIERLDVQYLPSATLQYWDVVHCAPVYNGTGGPSNPTQYDLFSDGFVVWASP